jgi:hypothetical protein
MPRSFNEMPSVSNDWNPIDFEAQLIPDFDMVKDILTEFMHVTASVMEANQITITSLQRHKVAEPNRWCL